MGEATHPCRHDRARQGKRGNRCLALLAGDAMCLPFSDAFFDAVTVASGPVNMPDYAALREMAGVFRPGGPVTVQELSLCTA